jgi:hypothetical protein
LNAPVDPHERQTYFARIATAGLLLVLFSLLLLVCGAAPVAGVVLVTGLGLFGYGFVRMPGGGR